MAGHKILSDRFFDTPDGWVFAAGASPVLIDEGNRLCAAFMDRAVQSCRAVEHLLFINKEAVLVRRRLGYSIKSYNPAEATRQAVGKIITSYDNKQEAIKTLNSLYDRGVIFHTARENLSGGHLCAAFYYTREEGEVLMLRPNGSYDRFFGRLAEKIKEMEEHNVRGAIIVSQASRRSPAKISVVTGDILRRDDIEKTMPGWSNPATEGRPVPAA